MIRATNETEAGRRYLDLQRKAKQTGRPTDELIQLYGFLDRLARSAHADRFVLHVRTDGSKPCNAVMRFGGPRYPLNPAMMPCVTPDQLRSGKLLTLMR